MAYTNSSLVVYTRLSPNHSGLRKHSIDRISPHCVVGQCSVETLGNIFAPVSRQASSNYGIGPDGRIGMYVEEKNRSWCTSSNANDQRAVTIECASDTKHPYAMTAAVYASLIRLCTDICRRNGKNRLIWIPDKNRALSYSPAQGEMLITVHRWFANKSCPGDWLYSRLGDLASKVTAELQKSSSGTDSVSSSDTLYRVQVGAFRNKAYAERQLAKVKAAGYDTYLVQAGALYKVQVGAFRKKANADRLLTELKGKGFDAFVTTKKGKPAAAGKTVDELAREVIRGDWGNGSERKQRLIASGYDYNAVQARVNELLK